MRTWRSVSRIDDSIGIVNCICGIEKDSDGIVFVGLEDGSLQAIDMHRQRMVTKILPFDSGPVRFLASESITPAGLAVIAAASNTGRVALLAYYASSFSDGMLIPYAQFDNNGANISALYLAKDLTFIALCLADTKQTDIFSVPRVPASIIALASATSSDAQKHPSSSGSVLPSRTASPINGIRPTIPSAQSFPSPANISAVPILSIPAPEPTVVKLGSSCSPTVHFYAGFPTRTVDQALSSVTCGTWIWWTSCNLLMSYRFFPSAEGSFTPAEPSPAPALELRLPFCPTASALDSRSTLLAVGLTDGSIIVYDARSGAERFLPPRHASSVTCLAFHRNRYVVSGGADNTLRIFDTATTSSPSSTQSSSMPLDSSPLAVVCSDTDIPLAFVILSSSANKVLAFDIRSSTCLGTLDTHLQQTLSVPFTSAPSDKTADANLWRFPQPPMCDSRGTHLVLTLEENRPEDTNRPKCPTSLSPEPPVLAVPAPTSTTGKARGSGGKNASIISKPPSSSSRPTSALGKVNPVVAQSAKFVGVASTAVLQQVPQEPKRVPTRLVMYPIRDILHALQPLPQVLETLGSVAEGSIFERTETVARHGDTGSVAGSHLSSSISPQHRRDKHKTTTARKSSLSPSQQQRRLSGASVARPLSAEVLSTHEQTHSIGRSMQQSSPNVADATGKVAALLHQRTIDRDVREERVRHRQEEFMQQLEATRQQKQADSSPKKRRPQASAKVA